MFTQCPKCETTYRVSSDDLSEAHGEVECGNCSQRFDALARLSESLPMPVFAPPTGESHYLAEAGSEQESQQEQDQEQRPDEPAEEAGNADAEGADEVRTEDESDAHADENDTDRTEHESDERGDEDHTDRTEHESDERGDEDHTDRTEHESDECGDEDQLAHEDGRKDDLADKDWNDEAADQSGGNEGDHTESGIRGAGEFEDQPDQTIDEYPDDGDNIDDPLNEDPGNDDEAANEEETEADQRADFDPSETVDLGEYDWQHTTVIQPQKPPPMDVRFEDDPEAGLGVEVPADPDAAVVDDNVLVPSELTPAAKGTSKGWLRWAVIGVLLVCLFTWIHQTRGMLARNALLRPALSGFYAAIGIDLQPTWDISGFAILSSTASEERGGRLVVTATYTNIAEFPQPYPMLKVILEDRWGEPLDVRYFEPAEYLSGFVAGRPMGVGESATGEATIPSTGPSAVGFSVDVCLAPAEGDIRCASDL